MTSPELKKASASGVHLAVEAVDPIAAHVHGVLGLLGENPQREGLVKTPDRAAKALRYLTRG